MPFNPEGRMFAASERELSDEQEALYNILVPENEKQRINIDEFADLYGTETVAKDKAYIEETEKKLKKTIRLRDPKRNMGNLLKVL